MCPTLSSEALGLLRKAAEGGGAISVRIGGGTLARKNRAVMELLVADLIRPVALERDDERIVYLVTRETERAH